MTPPPLTIKSRLRSETTGELDRSGATVASRQAQTKRRSEQDDADLVNQQQDDHRSLVTPGPYRGSCPLTEAGLSPDSRPTRAIA